MTTTPPSPWPLRRCISGSRATLHWARYLHGPAEFEQWFERLYRLLPGLRLNLTNLVVAGWPWNTTVVARLAVTATLADGTPYVNEAIQWIRLRWGRMTHETSWKTPLGSRPRSGQQAAAGPGH